MAEMSAVHIDSNVFELSGIRVSTKILRRQREELTKAIALAEAGLVDLDLHQMKTLAYWLDELLYDVIGVDEDSE